MVRIIEGVINQKQFSPRWTIYDQAPPDDEAPLCEHLNMADGKSCRLLHISCILRETIIDVELYDKCPIVNTDD